jgi:AGZA family xanthine/uracil permease-like MFS transporter
VGDLLFFWMALDLMRRTGRDEITAMPLGLDTPSTFGMVFFVLGPAFLAAKGMGLQGDDAASYAWHIGIWSIVWSGLFKMVCALGSGWVRALIPRAGLLGSLTAVALVLISFLPLVEILHFPIVGLTALAITLTTLVARINLPGRIPGALGALIVAGAMFFLMDSQGWLGAHQPDLSLDDAQKGLLPTGWLAAWKFEWLSRWQDSLRYLPIVIPFALGTVVGGIDCTESAAAAGDEFDTGRVIAVEALATLAAGLCGGAIQTTPYIGHPAYKAMGGRSAYVLATALFIGAAGLTGTFGFIYVWLPKVTVLPILVFVGLEITSQSFLATPRKHYPAVALACVPALAALGIIFIDQIQGQYLGHAAAVNEQVAKLEAEAAKSPTSADWKSEIAALAKQTGGDPGEHLFGVTHPPGPNRDPHAKDSLLAKNVQTMRMLSNGFIVVSLLWATILATLIDRRLDLAALWCFVAAVCSLVGIIHSPLPGAPLIDPFHPPPFPASAAGQTPLDMAIAYSIVALLLLGWHFLGIGPEEKSDDSHSSGDEPEMPPGSAR